MKAQKEFDGLLGIRTFCIAVYHEWRRRNHQILREQTNFEVDQVKNVLRHLPPDQRHMMKVLSCEFDVEKSFLQLWM